MCENEQRSDMDSFFEGIDSELRRLIEEALPQDIWPDFIAEYNGPDTVEGRLEALGECVQYVLGLMRINIGGVEIEHLRPFFKIQGLIQMELGVWDEAVEAWRGVVFADDLKDEQDVRDRDLAAMFNFGVALNHVGAYVEAEDVYRRLLPMLEADGSRGKLSREYIGSLTGLMRALWGQNEKENVMETYEKLRSLTAQLDEPERSTYNAEAEKIVGDLEVAQTPMG